jgi:hypothetical protein
LYLGDVENENEHGPMLTGTLTKPLKFRFVHTRKFTIEFVPVFIDGVPNTRKGFLITYSSHGEARPLNFEFHYWICWTFIRPGEFIKPTTTTTTEASVPAEKLEYISKEIEVMEAEQTDETWEKIRSVLSNSTNMFLEKHNLNLVYEPARWVLMI